MAAIDSPPDLVAWTAALGQVRVFADFTPEELREVARRCGERSHKKGEVVWSSGDAGHEIIVVLSGELEVTTPDGTLVARLEEGECLGEMALLLDEPRTATVTASRRSRVLVLDGAGFDEIVRHDSRALMRISQSLAQRVVDTSRRRKVARSTTTVGVVAQPGVPGASLVAATVARLLADTAVGSVLLVRVGPTDAAAPTAHLEVIEHAPDPSDAERDEPAAMATLLDRLGHRHRVVVADLPAGGGWSAQTVGAVFDVVVELVDRRPVATGDGTTMTVINLAHARSFSQPVNRCDPYVLAVEPAIARSSPQEAADIIAADPTLPIARTLGRLARKLVGGTVGVALGGGAAFGLAHIGVLAELEKAGIPIDLLAGTSMGSIVAVGYAAGTPCEKMRLDAGRYKSLRSTLDGLDVSLSGSGLMAGRRFVQTISSMGSATTFDELVVPCCAVATDIQTGERVVIGTGRLDHAFRASSSVPVLFEPVHRDGRYLVDGALVDPVPGEAVRDMGADVVIAVNVVPKLDPSITTPVTRAVTRLNRLRPITRLTGRADGPLILDVLMNSLQIGQHELGGLTSVNADAHIDVDLPDFTWMDFTKAARIIERGARATRDAVPAISALIAERLAG